jgi:hypothetical protein
MYMGILQGNSLYSYLYLKHSKMLLFFFFLLQNLRTRGQTGPDQDEGVGISSRGSVLGKRLVGEYGAKNVYMCVNEK